MFKTQLFGISRDSVESHQKFIKKHKLTVDLISDHNSLLCDYFEVIKEKVMFGKKIHSIERSTFILDKNLNIVASWRKVKVNNHANEVLERIKSLR